MRRKKDLTQGLTQRPNGSWQIAVYIGGQRRFFTAKDPAAVRQKAQAAQEAYDLAQQEQAAARALGPLFRDVAAQYRASLDQAKPGTLRSYLPCLRRIVEEFGDYRMREIEPWMIAQFLRSAPLNTMAATTVCNHKTVINNIFQFWIDSPTGRGNLNPARETKVPRGLPRGKRPPPTDSEVAIVKAHADDPDALLPVAYLCTGERRGELCAIQLGDIDFKAKIIHITKSVAYRGNQPYLRDHTKTPAGIRSVPLLALLEQALQPYRHLPKSTYLVGLGSQPVTATKYRCMWSRFWRKYGVAVPVPRTKQVTKHGRQVTQKYTEWRIPVCGHQFRHEYVCMLAMAGIPEEIAIQLVGHANARMIHEIYLSLKPQMLSDARKKLDSFLSQQQENGPAQCITFASNAS